MIIRHLERYDLDTTGYKTGPATKDPLSILTFSSGPFGKFVCHELGDRWGSERYWDCNEYWIDEVTGAYKIRPDPKASHNTDEYKRARSAENTDKYKRASEVDKHKAGERAS